MWVAKVEEKKDEFHLSVLPCIENARTEVRQHRRDFSRQFAIFIMVFN